MTSRLLGLLLLMPLFATAADEQHAENMKAGLALFRTTIGPAINEHCLKCHGGEKIRGDLNLASRELLLAGGESGAAIDLRTPQKSLLLTLIRHEDEREMPPKKPKLADGLIADFGRWIELGTPYDKPLIENAGGKREMVVSESDRAFWSFAPLQKVTPPVIRDAWIRSEIDHFILARQQEAGLKPNPSADKRTLARRAYLDLIGMPPTPTEMRAFLDDDSADAYQKLLDRLLASEDYGPRWARHWMDVARFAESYGFEQNYMRNTAFHYRDFLIQAFNQDMPWDQFVSWQLAGDELAPQEPLAMMATGFLAAGVFPTQLTEAEFESARYDELDDMLGTSSMAFLGLSVACARCHDHKYDPIPAKDYYAMAATFATAIRSEANVQIGSGDAYNEALAKWQTEHDGTSTELADYLKRVIEPLFDAWLRQPTGLDAIGTGSWSVLEPKTARSAGGATLTRQADASWLVTGKNPKDDAFTIVAPAAAGARALRVEALTHKSLKRRGPGRATNGNIGLSDIKISARANGQTIPVKLVDARATHQQNTSNLAVKGAIDGNPVSTGWAVDLGGIGKDQAAIFVFDKPLASDAELTLTLTFKLNTQHVFGRFRLAVANNSAADFELNTGVPALLASGAEALKSKTKPAAGERLALLKWFKGQDVKWQSLRADLDAIMAAKPAARTEKVMICSEGVPKLKHHANGRGYPHYYKNVHYLTRGDPKQKGR